MFRLFSVCFFNLILLHLLFLAINFDFVRKFFLFGKYSPFVFSFFPSLSFTCFLLWINRIGTDTHFCLFYSHNVCQFLFSLVSGGMISFRSSIISCSILLQINISGHYSIWPFLSLSIHHSHSQIWMIWFLGANKKWKKANSFLTQLSGPFSHNKSHFLSNSAKHYRMAPIFQGKMRKCLLFCLIVFFL